MLLTQIRHSSANLFICLIILLFMVREREFMLFHQNLKQLIMNNQIIAYFEEVEIQCYGTDDGTENNVRQNQKTLK